MFIGTIFDIWCIVYKKRRYITVFTYEKDRAKDLLFKIAIELQTNKKLIADYWQLFFSESNVKKSEKKSIWEFITENEVKLKAFWMGESMRWEVFNASDWSYRPDAILFDDIDVLKSVSNPDIIEKNYRFLKDEVFWWLAWYAQIRILWNVIREDWLNPRLREEFRNNKDWIVKSQWIYDKEWNITRDRFVETDEEAQEYNKKVKELWAMKISLEKKKRELWEISFSQNFLGIPYANGQSIIRRADLRYFDYKNDKYDYITIGIDPAFSEKTLSDDIGITVTGFQGSFMFVIESFGLSWEQKLEDNVDMVISNLYKLYNVNMINIESNNWGMIIWRRLRNKGMAVNIMNSTKDKVTRLSEYQWEFQRWNVRFNKEKTNIAVDQLLSFPNSKKDDIVDSIVFSLTRKKEKSFFTTSI